MTEEQLLQVFSKLGKIGGASRSPEKALMALLALGKYQSRGETEITFGEVFPQLKKILSSYGNPSRDVQPSRPFFRLALEKIWRFEKNRQVNLMIKEDDLVFSPESGVDIQSVKAGFNEEVLGVLKKSPHIISSLSAKLLDGHFPRSLHTEILRDTGLETHIMAPESHPGSEFRQKTLRAYGYQCAVCGFQAWMESNPVGVAAVHLRWPQAGGSESVDNGLCLCSTHQYLFDRGVLTLTGDLKVEISRHYHGNEGSDHWVRDFDHQKLKHLPADGQVPHIENIKWHRKEVFQSKK